MSKLDKPGMKRRKKKKQKIKLKDRIRRWFSERYGDDELSKFLYIISLILMGLSLIPALRFLLYVALLMIFALAIRSLSGNIEKRSAANERFLHIFRMSEKDRERRNGKRNGNEA